MHVILQVEQIRVSRLEAQRYKEQLQEAQQQLQLVQDTADRLRKQYSDVLERLQQQGQQWLLQQPLLEQEEDARAQSDAAALAQVPACALVVVAFIGGHAIRV